MDILLTGCGRGLMCVLIGLDYGGKRIGVAVSDPLRVIAAPLGVIHRTNWARDIESLRRMTSGLVIPCLPW